jgi:hypothetical protein
MSFQCDICFGLFPKYILTKKTCQFCTNRMDIEKNLTIERSLRIDLEDKGNILEARLDSILGKPDYKHKEQTSDHNSFIQVNNRKKISPRKTSNYSMDLNNRFEILNNNESLETLIVGDSVVRNIGSRINNRKNQKKKNITYCYPGAKAKFIKDKINEMEINVETCDVCITVGGNDIRSENNTFTPTEEIIKSYKEMLETAKQKSRKVIVLGILPRMKESLEWHSRAISINNRIKDSCKNIGINFVDVWDQFYENKPFFDRKGIHFSNTGIAKFSEIIITQFNSIQEN